MVLFISGVAFLAVEIFVLPGFGVAGVTGILLMLAGVIMASQNFFAPGELAQQWKTLGTSILVVSCSPDSPLWPPQDSLSRYFGSLPHPESPDPAAANVVVAAARPQEGRHRW